MPRFLFPFAIGLSAVVLGFVSPPSLWAQANLENPQPGSSQSGIGVISGWVCSANRIDIVFDEVATLQAAYGTSRDDTRSVCGDANNGFGLLFNWNLLRDGGHTVRVLADGVPFASVTFTVTTLETEFLRGASGSFTLKNFPNGGTTVMVHWEESLQNFVIAGVESSNGNPFEDNLMQLERKLKSFAWLAYAPTKFNPNLGCPSGYPAAASIRADLEHAFAHGFRGLITFAADCTLKEIPRLAKDVGFEGVIMGLFLFNDTLRFEEMANARAAAEYVDGYAIGNEGLIGCGGNLYTPQKLMETMEEIRTATQKPVTTAEQIEDYLDGGCLAGLLLQLGDWLFPIIHPFNNGMRNPQAGVAFTEDRMQNLSGLTNKTVFFKETGWPTGGDPAATEANQESYFQLLKSGPTQFAYFEGFDQPWKPTAPSPWEPFWGLFRQNRTPKQFINRNQP